MFNSFPFYKQLDQMDCGPACLRMIAKHHGRSFLLPELRAKSYITREGVSMLGISDAAEAIGMRTLSVKLPFETLSNGTPLPCIVHWNQNHFAVVYKTRKGKIYVADPAVGLLTYSKEEFIKCWLSITSSGQAEGMALFLEPTPAFYQHKVEDEKNVHNGFRYLFSYLKSYRKFIFQLAFWLLVGSGIQLAMPFLTQSVVDKGIHTRNVNFITMVLFGQLMLFTGQTVADFVRRRILLHLSTRINLSILSSFLAKLMQLPMDFFDSKKIGDILQRMDDHSRIERFISSSSLSVLFSFFNLIVFGVVLATYNLSIFTIFFVASAVYIGYVLLFLKIRKELDYKRFNVMSRNRGSIIQLINGMQEIKLNNCERSKRWEWENIQELIFKLNVDTIRLQQWQEGGSMFINELKNILITFMAATAVISGSMTLGMMMAAQYIIGQLNAPIHDFVGFIRDLQDARISLDRIGEVQLLENEDTSPPGLENTLEVRGSIIAKNLSFQYEGPNSPKALDGLEITIETGKVTAIVGASGSGKTTLLKLLLKFYPPTTGRLTLGGVDFKDISAKDWRGQCGVVMQEGFIFSDTIARNIGISDEKTDNAKLKYAATVANIHEFIETLPLGYQAKIGPDGMGISAGQRQRILIARAVYKNPAYLFFDEATSALDANNEKVIMENLDEFFEGKTVIVIAHRLSTVKNADKVLVLEKGKVVETGTHAQLAAAKGKYYKLVKNQLELGS